MTCTFYQNEWERRQLGVLASHCMQRLLLFFTSCTTHIFKWLEKRFSKHKIVCSYLTFLEGVFACRLHSVNLAKLSNQLKIPNIFWSWSLSMMQEMWWKQVFINGMKRSLKRLKLKLQVLLLIKQLHPNANFSTSQWQKKKKQFQRWHTSQNRGLILTWLPLVILKSRCNLWDTTVHELCINFDYWRFVSVYPSREKRLCIPPSSTRRHIKPVTLGHDSRTS